MVTLKSTTQCPPGGFLFFQPETNYQSEKQDPVSQWDFRLLCRNIQKMRQANPRFNLNTDINAIGEEVKIQNALRLLSIPNTESYLMENKAPGIVPPKLLRPLRRLPGVAAASKLITGASTLADWLGHGGIPVDKEKAERRASICLKCPMNQQGDWFTDQASAMIKSQIGIKNDLDLKTSVDDKLFTCKVCLCPLPLKVWAPLEIVKSHLSDSVKNELPGHCWIVSPDGQ